MRGPLPVLQPVLEDLLLVQGPDNVPVPKLVARATVLLAIGVLHQPSVAVGAELAGVVLVHVHHASPRLEVLEKGLHTWGMGRRGGGGRYGL